MFNRVIIAIVTVSLLLVVACSETPKEGASENAAEEQMSSVQANPAAEIPFLTITGEATSLASFVGNVVLIVNVASKCGYTPQYAGLEELYRTYRDSGLIVVGFPANNFGGQEPGSDEEILKFCQDAFDVTFPLMSKVSVTGDDKHPLFVALTEGSDIPGEIGWNFSKFLLDRKGQLQARYESGVEPMSDELVGKVRELL